MDHRIEHDSLGEIFVSSSALWGAQTQRALANFPISQWLIPQSFIESLALLKGSAALANGELGHLSSEQSQAIYAVSEKIAQGLYPDSFPLDVFQTGSGTSFNMNMNEVIAHLVQKEHGLIVHPNDHVNMGQSSNDVIPSVIHISALLSSQKYLLPALDQILLSLSRRQSELAHIVKTGRTHLMDALPLTMGQEISGWIAQIRFAKRMIENQLEECLELAIGGTAIGTGLNASPDFTKLLLQKLNQRTGLSLRMGQNFFELLSSQDRIVSLSGSLKTLATALSKIANDLRWMSSGPISGLGEIQLPSVQPGSSIMPGKVNPVILESCLMVCTHVIGADQSITLGGMSGNFQLNVMLPMIAYHILENIRLLGNTCSNIASQAIDGFIVHESALQDKLSQNPILITALNRKIGYELGAKIAKRALQEKRSVVDIACEETSWSREELEQWLNPADLTRS